ncbi:MAG: hypothetical protein JWO87_4096, partial [Phycisphaerales bacterium]|nr:hypothetical protein [Phycisphaerales bacterium]
MRQLRRGKSYFIRSKTSNRAAALGTKSREDKKRSERGTGLTDGCRLIDGRGWPEMNPVRRDWPPLIGPDRQRENDIKVCVTFHLYFVRLSGVMATH